MSGNLFEDRNWLLPPNYLSNENKTVNQPKNIANITSPRPLLQEEEPKDKCPRKMWLGTRLPFLQVPKERRREQAAAEGITKGAKATN